LAFENGVARCPVGGERYGLESNRVRLLSEP
jgi:hypothetical protein